MNENCRECPYIQNLEDRVGKLEGAMEGVEKDVSEIKVNLASNKEQVKTIFEKLKEIKDSILKLSTDIKNIQLEPANNAEKIKITIITSACSGIIGIILGLIFSK
ncbi:hypothetical protein [Clostridium tyrobutyricum]|uniref:hypothetical protein n=1 Tax=Clostridium tyrobutyricum TaxID=1519 RepID=UPI001C3816A9|nr:hypothetical protein [Clostridium tyrobutyricum]MBV4423662.1 hypothetical protein [Clostridium tyrobutyricum]